MCTFAKDIWARTDLGDKIAAAQQQDSATWFEGIIQLHNFNVELFAAICYMIRYFRDRALFEGVWIDAATIHKVACTLISDYGNTNLWPERFPNSLGSKLWRKPPARGLRIYVDGAISPRPAGGTGVFITDETGTWIHGACKFYLGIGDPLVIELIAMRDSPWLAWRLGLSTFVLLSDSEMDVQSVLGEEPGPSLCASILMEIREHLLNFVNVNVFWTRRGDNTIAHELVFLAKNRIDCNDSWPSCLDDVLSIKTG